MVDMLMTVAPGLQTGINAVLIRINGLLTAFKKNGHAIYP
jgi:hypothetical protein